MTKEPRAIMINLYNAERDIEEHIDCLEIALRHANDDINNKVKRISQLQRDIDGLKRRNKELQQEIDVKNYIINQLVIQLEKAKNN